MGRRITAEDFAFMQKCVNTFARRLPEHVDRDELESAAQFALVKAADRFDPCAGAAWRTYAWVRMTGSMIDALRSLRPGTRSAPAEQPISLESKVYAAMTVGERVEGDRDTAEVAILRDGLGRLADAVAALSRREREMVLADLNGESLGSVAARWGISESRGSQIAARSRKRLAAAHATWLAA